MLNSLKKSRNIKCINIIDQKCKGDAYMKNLVLCEINRNQQFAKMRFWFLINIANVSYQKKKIVLKGANGWKFIF